MKLLNSTNHWSDRFLRRMVSWICKEMDLPLSFLKQCQFARINNQPGSVYRGLYRGRAWYNLIRCSVDTEYKHFPHLRKPYRKGAPEFTFHDVIEVLVQLTAHELSHIKDHQARRRERGKHYEAKTEFNALFVLNSFRKQREVLLAHWSEPEEMRAAADKPSLQEMRRAKAVSYLSRWERKLKLAKTKVRLYQRKIRYYDRRTA